MKTTYIPGGRIEQLYRRADRIARLMPELRVTSPGTADVRQLYDQFANLDSLSGVELTNDGGVELSPSANANYDFSDTTASITQKAFGDAGAVRPFFGPAGGEQFAAWVHFVGTESGDAQLTSVQAYLNPQPNPNAQPTVVQWVLQLFQVQALGTAIVQDVLHPTPFPVIELLPLIPGGFAVQNVLGAPGWVLWDLATLLGAGAILPKRGPLINVAGVGPALVVVIFGKTASGAPASNCGWAADTAAAGGYTANLVGSTIQGVELDSPPGANGVTGYPWSVTLNGKTGAAGPTVFGLNIQTALVPNIQLGFNTFTGETVSFSGAKANKVFLDFLPDAHTEFVLRGNVPVGAAITATVSDGTHTAPFVDGQPFGMLTPALTPQLTGYDVSITLTPTPAADASPILRAVGMQAVATTNISDVAEVVSGEWLFDPTTHRANIPELRLRLIHDGPRDFRDVCTDLLSQNPAGNLSVRLWIGHPSTSTPANPYNGWLHLDDFPVIDDWDPQAADLTLIALSPLALVRGGLPVLTPEVDQIPIGDGSNLGGPWTSSAGSGPLYQQIADAFTTLPWPGATTAVTGGDQIVDANSLVQRAVANGVTGASAPTWNTQTNGYTYDGSVVWQCLGANAGLVPNDATFILSPPLTSSVHANYVASLSGIGNPGLNVVPLLLVRYAALTAGHSLTLTVSIFQGSTAGTLCKQETIAVSAIDVVQGVYAWTPGEIALVSNWSDLVVQFTATANGADTGGQMFVTWFRNACPPLRQNLVYANQSPRQIVVDLLTNQQPVDPRYDAGALLAGLPGLDERLTYPIGPIAQPLSLGKTIRAGINGSTDLSQLKHELDAVGYVSGFVLTSEEGLLKCLRIYTFGPAPFGIDASGNVNYQPLPPTGAPTVIPIEELEPSTVGTPNFRSRVPLFGIPYGYDPTADQWAGEALGEAVAPLVSLNEARIDPTKRLDGLTAQWVGTPELAGGVGSAGGLAGRHVSMFGCGIMVWRFRTTYPHPELSLGDPLVIQTDRVALYDFLSGRALSGVQWVTGYVCGIHNVWGTELSMWVPSYLSVGTIVARSGGAGQGGTQQPPAPPVNKKPLVYIKPLTGGQLQVNVVPDPTHTGMRVALSTVSQPAAGTGTLIAVTPGVAPVPIVSGPYTDTETVYATVTPYVDAAGTIMAQPVYTQTTMSYRYRASVYQSSASLQSIPNATLTKVTFDTVNYDNGSLTNLGAFNTRVTVPAGVSPGVWIVSGQVIYAANATGQREALIYKNGALLLNAENIALAATVAGSSVPVLLVDPEASPGDYYELVAWQNAAGALSLAAGGAVGSTLQAVHVW